MPCSFWTKEHQTLVFAPREKSVAGNVKKVEMERVRVACLCRGVWLVNPLKHVLEVVVPRIKVQHLSPPSPPVGEASQLPTCFMQRLHHTSIGGASVSSK